ncbi:hypothetical protein VNO80_29987 [Phaseolus coccineus]|uniref:Mannose/glucose-specific lectin n=1 Tax=Phaseolus coccineus TaxID=3886 RepID=A0AAN9LC04_PHACN
MSFEEKPVSVGPWGGKGGYLWDDGVYSTVRQLVISHGEGIDSIQIEYDKNGRSIWSLKYGGSGGYKIDKIKLDYPDEFLTSIDGYFGSLTQLGPIFIRSLSFESNRKIYGPFGVEQGTYFSLPMTGGKIVGFLGRYGWHVDAIGVKLKSSQQPSPSKALSYSHSYVTNTPENGSYNVIQGSVGQGYDIVLALKQKDDFGKTPTVKISSFKEPDYIEPKEKVVFVERASSMVEGVVTYGPWGGTGGYVFDDGPYTGVRQIDLSRNVGIVWIRILYDLDGDAVWGYKHGGTGGFKHEKIIFDFPYEVLTHVSGYYGSLMYMGPAVIRSLTFHTTKKSYGPFGDEHGTSYFTTKLREGKVVGFHGRSGLFLDSLGVHAIEGKVIVPVATPSMEIISKEPTITETDNSQLPVVAKLAPIEQVSRCVIKEPAPCGPGPWGGDGGRPWDDGVFSGIKQIYLTKAPEGICSIQIEYDRYKQSVWSVKHGGNGGNTMHRIKLEYPNEVVTCISGYYGSITANEQPTIIKSLTFHTSRGQYGPFGDEVGKYFTSTKTEGKVVGLHGRSSMYLDAIGVHMQHWLGSQKTSKLSFFKLFDL